MGKNLFKTVCLVLAALFTMAAIKGIFAELGAVLIVPALCAIVLVIVAYGSRNRDISS